MIEMGAEMWNCDLMMSLIGSEDWAQLVNRGNIRHEEDGLSRIRKKGQEAAGASSGQPLRTRRTLFLQAFPCWVLVQMHMQVETIGQGGRVGTKGGK